MNVADRLLRSHLDLSVTRIPVYPTNAYSLEAHRLLQVAANLYDVTQTNWYPSVFRPIIGADPLVPGGLAVTNFVYDPDETTIAGWLNTQGGFDVPLVIGAKKGIPNFNEYVMQTTALCARKLELRRPNTNSPPTETNQMYVLGISNVFAVETWNSYTQACCMEDVTITVGTVTGVTLTNDQGLYHQTNSAYSTITTIASNQWSGFEPRTLRGGFQVPLYTNIVTLTNSAYHMDPPRFAPISFSGFERGRGYPIPEWTMHMSNRVVYILSSGGRILDFVSLRMTNSTDLSELFFDLNVDHYSPDAGAIGACWDTNRVGGSQDIRVPTGGIMSQMQISVGDIMPSISDWNDFNFGPARTSIQIQNEIQSFRSFCRLFATPLNPNLVVQAPFSPARKFVQTITWQANDPLVHHMVDHLKDVTNNVSQLMIRPRLTSGFSVSNLNSRYRPWGGRPGNPGHPNDFNPAVKDPGVFSSDYWNFPTNLLNDVRQLGRVHRGTPWQTIYLKSAVADPLLWDLQFLDPRSHPTNDWKIVSTVLPIFMEADVRHLASVNEPAIASWRGLLHGITVISNTAVEPFWFPPRPEFATFVMESNSIQAGVIAEGIQRTRALRQPPYFPRVGDVLATPELSLASPWLNTATTDAVRYGITDEAYEKIPEQLLPRLRSEPVLSIHRMPGQTQIAVEAYPGYTYRVQASGDLQSWRTVGHVFAQDSEFTVTDSTIDGQTFYRAVIVP